MPKRVSKRNQQEWHLCSARSDVRRSFFKIILYLQTSRNDLLNPPASLIRCPARESPRQNSSTDTEEVQNHFQCSDWSPFSFLTLKEYQFMEDVISNVQENKCGN